MKRILLLLGVLVALSASYCFAQEGVIDYEVKINMHRNLPPGEEGMKAMIPEFRTQKLQLFFNQEASLYKPAEEDDDEEINGGGGVQIRMRQPMSEVYTEPAQQRIVELREFFDKKYLIEDTLRMRPWKLGTETKTIAGYACRNATFASEDGKEKLLVWYTDKIRPSLGPDRFASLPGTVLEVDTNDGERIITAKTVTLRALKKAELKVPSGGTKMTSAAFRKMVDEQIRKMGGSNGRVIIRN
ncbi:MAG: GLPGLI family protein [Cyclobacteriaceae bacterium]|nr:GLPGLI family protein [Cyclobacteriaceae bacterium]